MIFASAASQQPRGLVGFICFSRFTPADALNL